MQYGSFFRAIQRRFKMIHIYWRTYGGFCGTAAKILEYARRHGLAALTRRLFSFLHSKQLTITRFFDPGKHLDMGGMIHLDKIDAKPFTPPSICVHLHLFYADLAEEFCASLQHIPFPFTLLVSVISEKDADTARKVFAALKTCRRCEVVVVENHGRDIGPFFCTFGEELAKHDIIMHLHSKRSLHATGWGNSWRKYLLRGLLGSAAEVTKILYLFHDKPTLGLVYPQTYHQVPSLGHHCLANSVRVTGLLARMGYPGPGETLFDFPVGSMFWARTAALRPLFNLKLRPADFEKEAGQLDGTLAHALERVIGYAATQNGYEHAVLRMLDNPQQLRWGLEQSQDLMLGLRLAFTSTRIRLVIFDIFDTLLLRPLRDADDTKKIVTERLPAEDAAAYAAWRRKAEEEARARFNKDVDSDDIFRALADLAGVSPERAAAMQKMENEVELHSVSACAPTLEYLRVAREHGMRVVYASDMFLKREIILEMLRKSGVPEPDHLYLSNEINCRKDTGAMQRHILEVEGLHAEEALIFGDNPRSDLQISSDMGMTALSILRMPDMLQASPRYAWLAQEPFLSAQDSLSVGLVFRHMRQQARPLDALMPFGFFHDFTGLGYGILGPVLTGFSAWLAGQAREKGIESLYFLARDGKIMRHAYEAWRQHTGEGPPSEYLEVSRRSVSVPAIDTFEDLMAIMSLQFKGSDCRMLFRERLGLELSDDDVRQLQSQGLWPDFAVPGMDDAEKGKHVRNLAKALWPRIQKHAQEERAVTLAYLRSMKLTDKRKAAFVDVGYTGSIQRHAAKLLGRPLQGFYLLTGNAIPRASLSLKDTFAYIEDDCLPLNPFIRASFKMEKLLSASEGQVVSYQETDTGEIAVLRREFSETEQGYDFAREELRAGLDAFIRDAGAVRKALYPGFVPSHHAAASMWLQLEGLDILDKELLLDDFYCEGSLI